MNTGAFHFASGVSALALVAACSSPVSGEPAADLITIICPDASTATDCAYTGLSGLQAAIDEAGQSARIRLLQGEYVASDYRDVPFQDLHVRGAVVIDGKELSISADEGAVIRGRDDFPVSAIVVTGSTVAIEGLRIADFRYEEPEDDVYDGHGIFTIGSDVSLKSVQIEGIDKMALTGRDDGKITARDLSIIRSHLGVWLEETASVDIVDSRIVGSESAALAIYGNAVARISDSLIDANEDDGLYTEDEALIESRNNTIQNNAPFGARAAGASQIVICGGQMTGNEADTGEEGDGSILVDDQAACDSN